MSRKIYSQLGPFWLGRWKFLKFGWDFGYKKHTPTWILCKKKDVSYTKPLLIIHPEHIRMYMYTFLNSVQRKLRKHTANYFQDVQKKTLCFSLKKKQVHPSKIHSTARLFLITTCREGGKFCTQWPPGENANIKKTTDTILGNCPKFLVDS